MRYFTKSSEVRSGLINIEPGEPYENIRNCFSYLITFAKENNNVHRIMHYPTYNFFIDYPPDVEKAARYYASHFLHEMKNIEEIEEHCEYLSCGGFHAMDEYYFYGDNSFVNNVISILRSEVNGTNEEG